MQTPSDFLLAAILQELKTQNTRALIQLKVQQEKEQVKLQEVEKQKKKDDERFEEIRYLMYA